MVIRQKLKQLNRLAIAALLLFVMVLPLLEIQKAGAYGLLPSRSITMSSSADGDLTAGQSVTYHVRFDISTATDFGGIVIEFCDNNPIIGDTGAACNNITTDADPGTDYNFSIGTPTVSGQSDAIGFDPIETATADDCNISTFTTATALTAHTLALTAASPVALAAGATCFFDITTVTNPNAPNHTFFGRIYAYSEAAEASGYTLANPNAGTGTFNDYGGGGNDDDYIDAGGVALSTAEQITVTAKVPEKLTFCVYTTGAGNDCSAKSGNAITLGDNNGVLSDIEEFVNANAKYTVATNALYNVAIRIKGGTLKTNPGCSEATGQNCSIDAIGAAAVANGEGTEQFGFCTYESAGSGITPQTPYDDADCVNAATNANAGGAGNGTPDDAAVAGTAFAYDNNATDGTVSTYGDIFASKVPGIFSTGILVFLGNITTTTEPGIYTTTLTFIATGTY